MLNCKNCIHDCYTEGFCESQETCNFYIDKRKYVEVVHGEWIWTKEGEADWQQYWVCSECSDVAFFRTNYCSNCGANMMEENKND